MEERDAGELTAPAQSEDTATEDGQRTITAVLGAVETPIGTSPDTVVRMNAVRFSQYIVEAHL